MRVRALVLLWCLRVRVRVCVCVCVCGVVSHPHHRDEDSVVVSEFGASRSSEASRGVLVPRETCGHTSTCVTCVRYTHIRVHRYDTIVTYTPSRAVFNDARVLPFFADDDARGVQHQNLSREHGR